MVKCTACEKDYDDLEKHLKRQPMCKRWNTLVKETPLANVIMTLDKDKDGNTTSYQHTCMSCSKTYSSKGNLNKHLENTSVCNKYTRYLNNLPLASALLSHYGADYRDECITISSSNTNQNTQTRFSTFEPSDNTFMHIIWNIFLMDKEHILTSDEVAENNIAHIIAMLPDKSEYKQTIDCPHSIMLYDGHTMTLNIEQYDTYIHTMEKYRKERKNVFIFCNNGYQRSIPFLCYYLTKHHSDEVPTIEKAIDIILPQVDKENYAKKRGPLITQVETIFRENKLLL